MFKLTFPALASKSVGVVFQLPSLVNQTVNDPYQFVIEHLMFQPIWMSSELLRAYGTYDEANCTAHTRTMSIKGDKPLNFDPLAVSKAVDLADPLHPFDSISRILEAAVQMSQREAFGEKGVYHQNCSGEGICTANTAGVSVCELYTGTKTKVVNTLTLRLKDCVPPNGIGNPPSSGTLPLFVSTNATTIPDGWWGPSSGSASPQGYFFDKTEVASVFEGKLTGRNDPFGSPTGQQSYNKYGTTNPGTGSYVPLSVTSNSVSYSSEQSNVVWNQYASSGGVTRNVVSLVRSPWMTVSDVTWIRSSWTLRCDRYYASVSGKGTKTKLGKFLLISSVNKTLPCIGYRISPPIEGYDDDQCMAVMRQVYLEVLRRWSHSSFIEKIDRWPIMKEALDSSFRILDSNMIENAAQWRYLRKQFPSVQVLRQIKAGTIGKLAKAGAGLYLWYRYVYKTNLKDGTDIFNSLNEIGNVISNASDWTTRQVLYGAKRTSSVVGDISYVTSHYEKFSVMPDKDPLNQVLLALRSLGLHPGLAQGWDLIPLSFVVDWFTNIGGALENVDDCVYRNRYNLEYSLFSDKHVTEASLESLPHLSGIPMVGTLICTVYNRTLSFQWPDVQYNFGASSPSKWFAAGAALLIARW